MTDQDIARRLHAAQCYWCQMGSPRCDGTPTQSDRRRAADWQAMARIIVRNATPEQITASFARINLDNPAAAIDNGKAWMRTA